jgi:hypothetical protein
MLRPDYGLLEQTLRHFPEDLPVRRSLVALCLSDVDYATRSRPDLSSQLRQAFAQPSVLAA